MLEDAGAAGALVSTAGASLALNWPLPCKSSNSASNSSSVISSLSLIAEAVEAAGFDSDAEGASIEPDDERPGAEEP